MKEFTVSTQEWDVAANILKQAQVSGEAVRNFKISRKKYPELTHSFIVMKNQLYALERDRYYAYGHYSRVKRVLDKNSDIHILQISPSHMRNVGHELEALARTQLLIGYFKAHRGTHHSFWPESKQVVHNKDYILMKFVPGTPLSKFLLPEKLNYSTTYILLALRMIQALRKLHALHIVHNQIRPENILVTQTSNDFNVAFVGFGESYILDDNATEIHIEDLGVDPPDFYSSAEKIRDHVVSYDGDVYALAMLIHFELGIRPVSIMKATLGRKSRPTLAEIEADLWCILADQMPSDWVRTVPKTVNHEKFTQSRYHHPELQPHTHHWFHHTHHKTPHTKGSDQKHDTKKEQSKPPQKSKSKSGGLSCLPHFSCFGKKTKKY